MKQSSRRRGISLISLASVMTSSVTAFTHCRFVATPTKWSLNHLCTTTRLMTTRMQRQHISPSWASRRPTISFPISSQAIGSSPSLTSTALPLMDWMQSFFGGGAYNLKIDYDSLDFPGPELASLARETETGDAAVPGRSPSRPHLELATFAGGCFWGLELAFQRQEGVEYTMVGYTQGREVTPTYEQVGAGNTGHTEAVCVYFDPTVVAYSTLLSLFFQRVDPTTVNGQGRDFGSMYRTGIYYHSEEQKILARSAMAQQQAKYKSLTGRPLATECKQATAFWPAEGYHQQYLAKGGRFGEPQSTEKNCQDEIRCYG